jgi:hypothetical protein
MAVIQFSVTIPVSGTVTYQWQESTNGGSTYTNIAIRVFIQARQRVFKSNLGVTSTQNGFMIMELVIIKNDYVCGNIISSSADFAQTNVRY